MTCQSSCKGPSTAYIFTLVIKLIFKCSENSLRIYLKYAAQFRIASQFISFSGYKLNIPEYFMQPNLFINKYSLITRTNGHFQYLQWKLHLFRLFVYRMVSCHMQRNALNALVNWNEILFAMWKWKRAILNLKQCWCTRGTGERDRDRKCMYICKIACICKWSSACLTSSTHSPITPTIRLWNAPRN